MATDPEQLQSVLSNAEAAFARGLIASADASAGWPELDRKLGTVRAYCRGLRAALIELDAAPSRANIDKARAICRELRLVFLEINRAATIPFHCEEPACAVLRSPRTTCWLNHLNDVIVADGHRETSDRCVTGDLPSNQANEEQMPIDSGAQLRRLKDTDGRRSILRQSIGLLALVLAYLEFFFADVQLKIVMIPSIFP